jgi:hypothetical protein
MDNVQNYKHNSTSHGKLKFKVYSQLVGIIMETLAIPEIVYFSSGPSQ